MIQGLLFIAAVAAAGIVAFMSLLWMNGELMIDFLGGAFVLAVALIPLGWAGLILVDEEVSDRSRKGLLIACCVAAAVGVYLWQLFGACILVEAALIVVLVVRMRSTGT